MFFLNLFQAVSVYAVLIQVAGPVPMQSHNLSIGGMTGGEGENRAEEHYDLIPGDFAMVYVKVGQRRLPYLAQVMI